MSSNEFKLELKSIIDNVLFKLSSELHQIINVEPGTGSLKLSSELHQTINVEPGTGSQDVNIDDNASANLQSKLHQVTVVEPRTYTRRREKFYNKHVMSKIGKADKKKVVMNLGGYYLHEHMFVDCFKPDGWMSNFVVSCLTNLWNKEWGDKTIISQLAVQELLHDKGDKLEKELSKEVLGRSKLIFIPIRGSYHWNLAVLDLTKKEKRVIDSMESKDSLATANRVLSKIEDYLKNFAISGFKPLNQKVMQQGNCNDCGFHTMLFIKQMHKLGLSLDFDGSDSMEFDGPRILKFRQELVLFILQHPENQPYTEGSSTTPNLSLGDREGIVLRN